ncbi:MAG: type II toxin-antitoxin system VapC family toxin [Pseudomonadota bacterium]
MTFVLDASVTLAWFFDDERQDIADELFARLDNEEAVVPRHWFAEVANGMLMGERRGRSSLAFTSIFIPQLHELSIVIDTIEAWSQFSIVLPLARAHTLTVYDAAYLELAERRGLPLATLDNRLAAAGRTVGVEILGAPE